MADCCRTSYKSSPDIGVYAALSVADTTTITTGETFYAMEGTFTNTPMKEFTLIAGPYIQLTGRAGYYEIDWHASVSGDSNAMEVHIGMAKNDETLTIAGEGTVGTYLKTANEVQAVSGTRVIWLEPGDTIQIQVTADDDGDVVTVQHFTTTIARFFR